MSQHPPPRGHAHDTEASAPSDLSDLTQTDALLDRLGGRRAGHDDLDDPAATLLAGLVTSVDAGPDVEHDVSRLVELLAGRPLFFGAEDPADESQITAADQPIELMPVGDPDRVIDLTDHAPVAPARQLPSDQDEADTTVVAISAAPSRQAARRRARHSAPGGGEWSGQAEVSPISHWHKALRQVSMPAAAVVALIALGSGVSAVVTGNPMAPVNGVSRVMSQLPGASNPQRSVNKAEAEIKAAALATQFHDSKGAQNHLAAARSALADVPAAQKAKLTSAIATVQTAIKTGTAVSNPVIPPASPPAGVASTPPPPASVAPTAPAVDPTPTATDSQPSTPPTTDSPTTPPTTEDTDPATTPPAADTTPAAVPDTP